MSHFKLCPRSAVKLLFGSAAVLVLGHFLIVCWQFVVKMLLKACNKYLSLLRFILWSGVRLLFCGCFRWIRLMIVAGLCSCRKASTSGSRHIPTCLEAQSPLSITWPVSHNWGQKLHHPSGAIHLLATSSPEYLGPRLSA